MDVHRDLFEFRASVERIVKKFSDFRGSVRIRKFILRNCGMNSFDKFLPIRKNPILLYPTLDRVESDLIYAVYVSMTGGSVRRLRSCKHRVHFETRFDLAVG